MFDELILSYITLALADPDPVVRFLRLLQQHPVIQNQLVGPNSKIVGHIVRDFNLYTQLSHCNTPEEALTIYSKALQVLSTHAKGEIKQFSEGALLIDGRIHLDAPVSVYVYDLPFYDLLYLRLGQYIHISGFSVGRKKWPH